MTTRPAMREIVGVYMSVFFERLDDQADIAMPDQTAANAGNPDHCCTILTRYLSYLNNSPSLPSV